MTPNARFLRPVLAALFSLAVAPGLAAAQQDAAQWAPAPPMPDEYDWVQTTSLEWLKGEIISMYADVLTFDSDELGVVTIDWEDVREVRSAGQMAVGLANAPVANGQILIEGSTIRILGDEPLELSRSEVISLTASTRREIDNWEIKLSLGANVRSGNSEQIETTGRAEATRRSATNRIRLEYLASFNETDGATKADNQRVTAGWSRYARHGFFFTPIYGEWYRDPFQNVASRWTVGTGVGFEIVDASKTSWEVGGGVAYLHTRFDDVPQDDAIAVSTAAFALTTTFEHDLTRWLEFAFDYRGFVVNERSGKYTHHMVTGFEMDITSIIDLDFTAIWDRIKVPQPDSNGAVPEQDDLRLVFMLGLEF